MQSPHRSAARARTARALLSTALLPAALLSAALSAGRLPAQHLVVYDPVGAGLIDAAAPNPLFPGPVPPAFVYPAAPPLPPPPGPGIGDSTVDALTGDNWYTDGATIGMTPSAAYAPPGPPVPPFPVGPVGLGFVTGMALDAAGGILWLTDGGMLIGVTPAPGTAPLTPLMPSPAPLSGLEWDGLSGTLLGVDPAGAIFTLSPAGVLVAPPIPPPPLPAHAEDLAIDKTSLPGPLGPRSIYVLAGGMVHDLTAPGVVLPGGSALASGLAFHAFPAQTPPVGVCPCPGFAHSVGTTGPMTTGNLGFGVTVSGLPPGQVVIFALDFAYAPALPAINVLGCGLGLVPGSATISATVGFADPLGTATRLLPLAVPAGLGPIYHQSATLCPADPTGLIVNPLQLLMVCGT